MHPPRAGAAPGGRAQAWRVSGVASCSKSSYFARSTVGVSPSGKAAVFGTATLGSNPSTPAILLPGPHIYLHALSCLRHENGAGSLRQWRGHSGIEGACGYFLSQW